MIKQGKWRNWSQTAESIPNQIIYPVSVEEISAVIKLAKDQNKKIRVAGASHSFTSLVKTDDILLSLDRLTGIVNLNEDEEFVEVYAGTRLFQLSKALAQKGYALENLGDIDVQSIAGAISTGTHGTGISFGNISSQVLELSIIDGKGNLKIVSEKQNAEWFQASLVSLGLLGIIAKVKLKIIKTPIYKLKSTKISFNELLDQLEQSINNNLHFEFFLFPYSNSVQVKTMNPSTENPQSLTFYRLKNLLLENYLFGGISELCRLFPRSSKFFSRMAALGVGTSTIVSASQNLFATPRLVKFREMEYCIPLEHAKKAIQEVRSKMEERQYHVHFPIECRTVKEDAIWLNPSFERTSFYMAFHMYKGMAYESYFHDMETIMTKYGGRPHWGKLHSKKQADLRQLYPHLEDFLRVRRHFDPQGIFINEYTAHLFGLGSTDYELE